MPYLDFKNWPRYKWRVLAFFGTMLIILVVTVVGTVILVMTTEDPCAEISDQQTAYKCSYAVAVPMVDDGQGNLTPDYSGCVLSDFLHPDNYKISLVGGNEWETGHKYNWLELRYKSGVHYGLEPNLYDFVIEDTFDPRKCRWTCDPTTEKFCKE